jgi:signal transduction histidine kinase
MFDKDFDLDLQNEPQRRAQSQLIEVERMSAIGRMACSTSHDMRHSLTAIYADAEFLSATISPPTQSIISPEVNICNKDRTSGGTPCVLS